MRRRFSLIHLLVASLVVIATVPGTELDPHGLIAQSATSGPHQPIVPEPRI